MGGSGFVRNRLVYNITPAEQDVKGGQPFILRPGPGGVIPAYAPQKTQTIVRECGSNPAVVRSIFW